MPIIMPIKELRNITKISDLAHKVQEPIFITKNGYSDLVVMSSELYDRFAGINEIDQTEKKSNYSYVLKLTTKDLDFGSLYTTILFDEESSSLGKMQNIVEIINSQYKGKSINELVELAENPIFMGNDNLKKKIKDIFHLDEDGVGDYMHDVIEHAELVAMP